jgi:hypothetical protein
MSKPVKLRQGDHRHDYDTGSVDDTQSCHQTKVITHAVVLQLWHQCCHFDYEAYRTVPTLIHEHHQDQPEATRLPAEWQAGLHLHIILLTFNLASICPWASICPCSSCPWVSCNTRQPQCSVRGSLPCNARLFSATSSNIQHSTGACAASCTGPHVITTCFNLSRGEWQVNHWCTDITHAE